MSPNTCSKSQAETKWLQHRENAAGWGHNQCARDSGRWKLCAIGIVALPRWEYARRCEWYAMWLCRRVNRINFFARGKECWSLGVFSLAGETMIDFAFQLAGGEGTAEVAGSGLQGSARTSWLRWKAGKLQDIVGVRQLGTSVASQSR